MNDPADGGWTVYLLECADGSLYTGITRDLARRLREHSRGRGSRYTRSRLPVRVVYTEAAPDRSSASRREAAIRRLPTRARRALAGAGVEATRDGRPPGRAPTVAGAGDEADRGGPRGGRRGPGSRG